METLKTAVKIIKKILFAAECCILAHILVFCICQVISEIHWRTTHTDQSILSSILFYSDRIVALIFIIEVLVFINYTAFRVFRDIFEIDKRNVYYGIGFISTSLISVNMLHMSSQYYDTISAENLNLIMCVSAIALFYYAYAGMGKKRRCADRQNENSVSQITGSCNQDETLPDQNTKENNQKKDFAVKVTVISLMAVSFFELMMNLLSMTGILTAVSGTGNTNCYFPAMSIMLLVFTIAVVHWKYSGQVFLTPRILAWIVYFLSLISIGFYYLHISTPFF